MSSTVTLCRFPGCRHKIATRMLMCLPHWRMVPKVIQRRVFATLGVYKDRGTSIAQQQYLHAVDDAIHAVRVALDREAASNAQ